MEHITDTKYNNESNMPTNDLLESSKTILNNCVDSLNQITTTCCMPERSPKMQAAFDKLNGAQSLLNDRTQASYKECQEQISQFGAAIGALYVSCCTDTREPLYQHILKQLNRVNNSLNTMLGLTH